jgi:hypothetical protein
MTLQNKIRIIVNYLLNGNTIKMQDGTIIEFNDELNKFIWYFDYPGYDDGKELDEDILCSPDVDINWIVDYAKKISEDKIFTMSAANTFAMIKKQDNKNRKLNNKELSIEFGF